MSAQDYADANQRQITGADFERIKLIVGVTRADLGTVTKHIVLADQEMQSGRGNTALVELLKAAQLLGQMAELLKRC